MVLVMFCVNACIVLFLLIKSNTYEKNMRTSMNDTLNALNTENPHSAEFTRTCATFHSLAEKFDCCALNGPSDFKNSSYVSACCGSTGSNYDKGCLDLVLKDVIDFSVDIILKPSYALLAIELLAFIILLCRCRFIQFSLFLYYNDADYLMIFCDFRSPDYEDL